MLIKLGVSYEGCYSDKCREFADNSICMRLSQYKDQGN